VEIASIWSPSAEIGGKAVGKISSVAINAGREVQKVRSMAKIHAASWVVDGRRLESQSSIVQPPFHGADRDAEMQGDLLDRVPDIVV
jgi:hypothetical protein